MRYAVVVARAFRGEPLVRKLIHSNEKLAYLASPESAEAVEAGNSIPIGFPKGDIFLFNSDTYEKIRTEWDHSGVVSNESWRKFERFF